MPLAPRANQWHSKCWLSLRARTCTYTFTENSNKSKQCTLNHGWDFLLLYYRTRYSRRALRTIRCTCALHTCMLVDLHNKWTSGFFFKKFRMRIHLRMHTHIEHISGHIRMLDLNAMKCAFEILRICTCRWILRERSAQNA